MTPTFFVLLAAAAAARAPNRWAEKAAGALQDHPQPLRRLPALFGPDRAGRELVETDDAECLESFISCETDEGCLACVVELVDVPDDAVDLPDGAEDWQCPEVVGFLHGAGLCLGLDSGTVSGDAVCGLWAACALAVQSDDDAPPATPAPAAACSASECVVPHAAWLGDGRCDDGKGSCYNTEACGWDGGDCCEATCESSEHHACGEDRPFACRDPENQGCGSRARGTITSAAGPGGPFEYALYSNIAGSYAEVHAGTSGGKEDVCLADGCYVLEAKADAEFGAGASWSVEAPDAKGALAEVAGGSAPAVCTFPVGDAAAEYCPKSCVDAEVSCADADKYVMELFDSGLNGWGFVGYSVHKHDAAGAAGQVMREGTLADGPAGLDGLCLPDPGCYTVTLQWGWWSEEVSWVLGRPGAGPVAAGGAPAQCDFSVGGDFCPATCAPAPAPAPGAPPVPLLTGGCDPDDAAKLPYVLELYDAEGDGWQGALYTVTGDDGAPITGTLPGGFQGEDELCLAPGCYDFDFDPQQGRNAKPSWALGDPTEGGVVFSGADAAQCTFAVGGEACPSGPHAKAACGFGGVETPPPTSVFECAASEALVVLRLVDSFGDGWNGASIKLTAPDGTLVDEATLRDGAYKEYPYCVDPGCYRVEASSGEYREEVSWQAVELLPDGSGVVRARGAAPESCGLVLAADGDGDAMNCDTGCVTRAAAEDDWIAKGGDDYWGEKDDDAYNYYYDYGDDAAKPRCTGGADCTVAENFKGWNAATELTDCLNEYAVGGQALSPFAPALWEERPELCLGTYDFGELDEFEECAKKLASLPDDVSRKNALAKECMALLVSAAPDASEELESDDELVKRLATMVYYAADTGFCDCASDEEAIPHCNDFDDFRAVVREAHEACDALDAVDCAYLGAYADACDTALVNRFGSLDLSRPDQCAYVVDEGCGGLPLPSVRRWDCLLQDNYELTDAQRSTILAIVKDCVDESPSASTDDRSSAGATDDHYLDTDDAAPQRHHHSSSDDDAGLSGGMTALIVMICLAVACAGAFLAYTFIIKKQHPRRFGGAYRDDFSGELPAFSPLPTENPMREPLSSSGYYEAPTGV